MTEKPEPKSAPEKNEFAGACKPSPFAFLRGVKNDPAEQNEFTGTLKPPGFGTRFMSLFESTSAADKAAFAAEQAKNPFAGACAPKGPAECFHPL